MTVEGFFVTFAPLIYLYTGAMLINSTANFRRTKPGTKEHVEAGSTLYLASVASSLLMFVLIYGNFAN